MLRGKKLVWKIPASHYDSKKPLGLPLLSSKPVIVVKKLFYDVENIDYDFFSLAISTSFLYFMDFLQKRNITTQAFLQII